MQDHASKGGWASQKNPKFKNPKGKDQARTSGGEGQDQDQDQEEGCLAPDALSRRSAVADIVSYEFMLCLYDFP